ncbi:MAG: UvrD-helicase domain-containing protein [Bacilli bacterium]|nr:UvrD-helicase domain-containing protein [Bacilli bacterium]
MKWTNDQLEAINHSGENILVSAGAGSGKTAILSERVIRILKDGAHINELLILTFTKAASEEMKERIRDNIISAKLDKELDLIDSSYITTFDSFALSMVKKYHYLVNVDKDISIMDSSILAIEKERIIRSVLEKYYSNNDEDILFLIKTLLRKDDDLLVNGLDSLLDKIDLEIDTNKYLDNISKVDNNERFKIIYEGYLSTLFTLIRNIEDNIASMEDFIEGEKDEKLVSKISDHYSILLEAKSYNDIINFINNSPTLYTGKIANSDINELKKAVSEAYGELKKICLYESEEFIETKYKESYQLSQIIFKLLKEIYLKYSSFKKENKMYSFMDIAKLAIEIFKKNPNIASEIRSSLKEIMIDEYQDTSSLQEEFMSYISNNNMYMVGDIKQSIYRFRYANPDLFKSKYKNYKEHNGGYLIDLNTNFRSRKEVLDNVNEIFSRIMQEDIGGANYKKDHMIEFGNLNYLKEPLKESHDLEIYTYNKKDYGGLNAGEIEAFITANDIINKIKSGYKLVNKKDGKSYVASYKDFVILVDKRSDFSNYKKIFEYFSIPTIMYENENIVGQDDMYIFKSLLVLVNSYKNNNFDTNFIHAFYSVARSYLFSYTDNEIYNLILEKNFKDNTIYKTYESIISKLDFMSLKDIFNELIFLSNWYEKLIIKGDAKSSEAKLSYLINLASNLDKLEYTIETVINYFDVIEKKEISIEIPMSSEDIDAVRFMTIHNSKGLEFPVCYFLGFNNKFNTSETKDTFILTKNGIIIPFYTDKYRYPNVELYSYKNSYLTEEVSEKIRLLYVSLTRSKEKMIIVTDFDKAEKKDMEKSSCFNNFMINILEQLNKYIKPVNIDELDINKDYKKYVANRKLSNKFSNFNYISIPNCKEEVITSKYSKELKLEDADDSILIKGNKLHNLLFEIDFKNPDYTGIDNNDKFIINRFINSDILNIKNSLNIFKELEFIDSDKHGFIDLVVEYENEYRIIDYKLSNIEDDNYISQLKGYKNYLSKMVNKPINLYLYSLFKGEAKKID